MNPNNGVGDVGPSWLAVGWQTRQRAADEEADIGGNSHHRNDSRFYVQEYVCAD